jgi:predicted transposase YbfD/YdcC
MEAAMGSKHDLFLEVSDPRAENARHDFCDMMFIALSAVLCGAESCADMALFGRSKEKFLRQFLDLPYGVPSHDTFSRLFRAIDPVEFSGLLGRFCTAFGSALRKGAAEVIAIDGKACRRGYDAGKMHVPPMSVTAWAAGVRLSLGYVAAEHGGEAAAALEVLQLVDIAGATVTADALHCHRTMAGVICEGGADYVLTLKGNQPGLLRDARTELNAKRGRSAARKDKRHSGPVMRRVRIVSAGDMAQKHDFPGLRAIIVLETETGGQTSERFFLASRLFTPHQAIRIIRAHWDIENGLHWSLDVTLKEDEARARKDNAPHNLAILRRLALNLARSVKDKNSLRATFKRAAWDDAFLLKLFAQMR